MSIIIYHIILIILILCIRGITLKSDNRISFITQQNYVTFQRKGNQELQVQALNIIVADLRNQIDNITSNNPPDNNDPDVGTM